MNCSRTLNAITNCSKTSDLTKGELILLWNIGVGVSIFCSVLGLYFSVTVTVFICKESSNKTPRWASQSSYQFSKHRATSTSDTTSSSTAVYHKTFSKKSGVNKQLECYKKLLHYILFAVILLILLRDLEEAALIHFGNSSNPVCDILTKIWIVWTALVIFGCHCFLWVKQQVIFSNPILKEMQPQFFRYVSYVTMVFMVLVLIGCSVTLILWSNYHVVGGICLPDIESQQFSIVLAFGFTSGLTACVQFFVSFLFIYPIVYNNRKLKSHEERKRTKIFVRPSDRDPEKSLFALRKKSETLNKAVKRTLVCSTITITTDCMEAAAVLLLPRHIPCAVFVAAYHVNVVLNIACLLCTYGEWRKFVVPCLQRKTQSQRDPLKSGTDQTFIGRVVE